MGNKDNIEKKHKARRAEREDTEGTSTVQQLAFTAAGAAGAAALSAILARQGYAPKHVSGTLAVIGAGLAGIGDSDALRALGAGAMSGSGAQLVLMMFAEYEDRKNQSAANDEPPAVEPVSDLPPAPAETANANVVPLATKAAAS